MNYTFKILEQISSANTSRYTPQIWCYDGQAYVMARNLLQDVPHPIMKKDRYFKPLPNEYEILHLPPEPHKYPLFHDSYEAALQVCRNFDIRMKQCYITDTKIHDIDLGE